jgi:hypothetical protein
MGKPLETLGASRVRDFYRSHRPALAVCVLLVLATSATAVLMAERTDGQFLYACDDFYINLGEARRLVDGTTYDEFPSTSTCAGWVLGMAGLIKLFGTDVTLFLVGAINVGAGLIATWALYRCLRPALPEELTFFMLVLFAWAAGVVPMALIGMEHLLHICFVVLFATGLYRALDGERGTLLPIWILAGALCRMETCFVAGSGALVLVVCRRDWLAALVLAAGALPVVAQGLWQLHQGHAFFSNPILIKTALNANGNPLGVPGIPRDTLTLFVVNGLLALVIIGRCFVLREIGARRTPLLMIAFFVMCATAHQILGQNHWLGRYQAYVVALGVVCVGAVLASLSRELPRTWLRSRATLLAGVAGMAVLMWGTAERVEVWRELPRVSREVYLQMFQSARLARSAEPGEPVILNDVGCTLFYTDAPVIDLVGLTCWDLAKVRSAWTLSPGQIDDLAKEKGAKMAVIYPAWFGAQIPETWVPVGDWFTPRCYYASAAWIRVYATDRRWKHTVEERWDRFAASLPTGVVRTKPQDQHARSSPFDSETLLACFQSGSRPPAVPLSSASTIASTSYTHPPHVPPPTR